MKKIFAVIIAAVALLTLIACASQTQTQNAVSENKPAEPSPQAAPAEKGQAENTAGAENKDKPKKALVVYFSWSGNTEGVAKYIAEKTGADVFKVVSATDYGSDYDKCVEIAKKEKEDAARPSLTEPYSGNIGDYDIVFVGYPCWWGTMPMAMFTFLEAYPVGGTKVAPFTTHEGSGFGSGLNDLRRLCPQAEILEGLSLRGAKAKDSQKEIDKWLESLKL